MGGVSGGCLSVCFQVQGGLGWMTPDDPLKGESKVSQGMEEAGSACLEPQATAQWEGK